MIGNVLQTREKHENDVVIATNTYDNRGRLLTTSTSLNGCTPATMAYVYDELGRLASKKYAGNNVVETYAYNVRGWLTEKNSSKFNMKLRYQNPAISGTQARFNGNITEWEWKQGANATQAYTFTYDGISRLTDNKQYTQSGSSWTLDNQFIENGLTYDQNGNIKTLQRNADGILTDNLTCNYTGNQLTSLAGISGSYLYDQNGNMTKDARKNLEIEYNSLNLLAEVKQGSTSKAKYTYAADGTKLAVQGSDGKGYYYRGSLIYSRNGSTSLLESICFSDGRILKTTSGYDVNYQLTDHLGSVRSVFDQSGTLIAQNDYYPFGGRYANSQSVNSTSNRFKYNGKEEQTTGDLGFLDYGFRMYDSFIGRLITQDPMQEEFYGINSYAYCFNDPMRYVDMLGLSPGDKMGIDIGTAYINGNKEDYAWFAVWIRQLAAANNGDKEKARQYAAEAQRLINDNLNGVLSQLAHKDYLDDGEFGSFFKFIGSEIYGQWTNPELVVAGLSAGIAGIQIVNSPLKATAKISKGAKGATTSKLSKNIKNKTSITEHGKERMVQRNVSDADIQNAIDNPLKVGEIKLDQLGRPSQKIVGETSTVVINPETGKIITIWKTSNKIKL